MHRFPTSEAERTLPPTPTRAFARNAAGPQIPARLSRTPTRHPRARDLRRRLPAPAIPSRQKTKSIGRQNENASRPARGPEQETGIFHGETLLGRGGLPRFSPPRQGYAASAQLHGTHGD